MNNRLEVLRARMHAEEAKPARVAKPRVPKVKVMKAVKSAPVAQDVVTFNPPISLMDAVKSLTPEEASSPKIVAATIALQLLDQLMRSSRPALSILSDNSLGDLAYVTSQVWSEKPDLKQVFSRAVTTADSIEFRTLGEEGEGIKRLHDIERALINQKLNTRAQ